MFASDIVEIVKHGKRINSLLFWLLLRKLLIFLFSKEEKLLELH